MRARVTREERRDRGAGRDRRRPTVDRRGAAGRVAAPVGRRPRRQGRRSAGACAARTGHVDRHEPDDARATSGSAASARRPPRATTSRARPATSTCLREADVGKRLRAASSPRRTPPARSRPRARRPRSSPRSRRTPPASPSIVGGPIREGVSSPRVAGTWTGSQPITLGYQWERCTDPGAATCPKIAGATRADLHADAADVGKYVRVTVTGVNAGGKAARSSVPTAAGRRHRAANVTPPTARATGTIKVGASLTVDDRQVGRHRADEVRDALAALRRRRGVTCKDVEGGNKPIYKLKAEDVNGTLLARPMRVVVTATNLAGSAEAASAPLGKPVTDRRPPAPRATRPRALRRKKKKAAGHEAAAGARARRKPISTGKTLASIKRLRFTPKGRLLLTLTCPKKAKTHLRRVRLVRLRRAAASTLDAGPIKKGKSKNVGFRLQGRPARGCAAAASSTSPSASARRRPRARR